MSIFTWIFKSKKKMRQPHTKRVKIGKYVISSHAQNRLVQKDRKIKKWDMIDNLYSTPNAIEPIKISNFKKSYNRIGKKITTSINPDTNVVATCRPISEKEIRKHKLIKRGNKYVKKNKR